MLTVTLDRFPEHEKQEFAGACAQYRHRETDFLIKREGEEVLVWGIRAGKGRRYKAPLDLPNWLTRFKDDLSEQYFRMI